MKGYPLLIVLFFGGVLEAMTQIIGSDDPRLQDIRQRAFRDNQPQALKEVASFPPDIALPFLSRCLRTYRDEKTDFFDAAREAIMKVPNYESYFASKLAVASRSGGVDNDTFEILSLIGSQKAQSTVAPYLFDFAMTPGNGHTLSEVNALSAAYSLGNMKIGDAPQKQSRRLTNQGISSHGRSGLSLGV